MSTASTHAPGATPEARGRRASLRVPEMWAAISVCVIWIVVLADALFGPDIVSAQAVGNFTRVPSAVVVAFFAWLATWVIARHGFRRSGDRGG